MAINLFLFFHHLSATSQQEDAKKHVYALKQTWENANDHFIATQDKLQQEIHRLQQKLLREDAAR